MNFSEFILNCQVLFFSQSDWYQSTFYDLCHPVDVEKIREQLVGLQRVSSCAVFGFNSSSESTSNGTNRHSVSDSSNIGSTSRTLDLKSGMIKRDGRKLLNRRIFLGLSCAKMYPKFFPV